jgi:hypothetical protein
VSIDNRRLFLAVVLLMMLLSVMRESTSMEDSVFIMKFYGFLSW